MSKGFLLETTNANSVVAPVPSGDIWLFASESNGKPVLRGKLPNGSFLTFGGSGGGGGTSFYQCASVDTAAGTWTGYKWEWDDTEGKYILSSSLTSDPLTIEGFTPIVGYTYSGNTRESADMWEGSTLGVGLVFYAPLATDASTTTGQTLTTQGTIEYTTVEGVPCAYFNGDYSCLYNFDFNSITGTNAFSFGTWVKNSEYTSQAVAAIGYTHHDRQSCEILARDGGAYFALYTSGASPELINFSSSNDGDWHHLFFVYDNGVRKTYFDGILANTDSNTVNMSNGVVIGSIPDSGSPGREGYFTGYLAGFRVYNRALTADEIIQLASEFTPTA